MSEAATREREFRQHWAVPGSNHDRLIRFAKVALPSAVGVLIAFLALAPLDKEGDVSFILDKTKVDNAPERMRVESARYVGQDNRGQKFEISAASAIQHRSDVPVVDINGMLARLSLAAGPGDDRRQSWPLRPRPAEGGDLGPGARRRARRLSARDARRHGRPQDGVSWRAPVRSREPPGSGPSEPAISAPTSTSEGSCSMAERA